MSLKIRLTRGGTKKRPFYSVVVADSRSPRDGRFIEKLGTYNPMLDKGHAERVVLKAERIQHWLKVGALPSERVQRHLFHVPANPNAASNDGAAIRESKPSAVHRIVFGSWHGTVSRSGYRRVDDALFSVAPLSAARRVCQSPR